jgi:hypothetical protein
VRGPDLTVDQLRRLQRSLRPKVAYLQRLRARMQQCQFPPSDRMLRDTKIAEAALGSLLSEVETYLSYQDHTPEPFR